MLKRSHSGIGKVSSICLHSILREFHIMEHAFQLLGKLIARFHFQFTEHSTLCIIRHRTPEEKSFGEMAFVITLKHIFVSEESEDRYGLVQHHIDFGLGFLWRQ